MEKGRVRLFNDISGFGFIEYVNCTKIIPFSNKEIKKTGYRILNEGQDVNFDVIKGKRGNVAANVTPVNEY